MKNKAPERDKIKKTKDRKHEITVTFCVRTGVVIKNQHIMGYQRLLFTN